MRILQLIYHRDVIQLDVQVLVHALEGAADGDVVLEFHRYFVVHERFEEAEEEHFGDGGGWRWRRGGGEVFIIAFSRWRLRAWFVCEVEAEDEARAEFMASSPLRAKTLTWRQGQA